jgi:hypothetical protein
VISQAQFTANLGRFLVPLEQVLDPFRICLLGDGINQVEDRSSFIEDCAYLLGCESALKVVWLAHDTKGGENQSERQLTTTSDEW